MDNLKEFQKSKIKMQNFKFWFVILIFDFPERSEEYLDTDFGYSSGL